MRRRLVLPAVLAAAALVGGAAAGPKAMPPEERLISAPGYRAAPAYAENGQENADARWLDAGTVPGVGTPWEDMAHWALVDIRSHLEANGTVSAGPGGPWGYFWPRDGSFAAVALSRSGHASDAAAVLDRLARLEFDPAVGFQARYALDGSALTDRPRQSDGCGWVLWAIAQVRRDAGGGVPPSSDELRDRCVRTLTRLVDGGDRLPPPSPDYWEVRVTRTSLGTVAPMLAGLAAAGRDYAATGDVAASARTRTTAARLAGTVVREMGPGYQRFGDAGGLDASVAMLLPPFTAEGDLPAPVVKAVRAAVVRYQREAAQPAGGVAPGVLWVKKGGASWTPQTALLALTDAASGRDRAAGARLDWLSAHRTAYGSIPEKVTRSGAPAGPAPLVWTASLVVLTLAELEGSP
ncbi:glycoside hydrolase family 15 [Phycicoccus sp. Root101]|uniref:glycoside hydrolase family 15 n=1 Tax=Phycicoccus sp. Root101 TaxID=1736421 RepID=UPI000ACB4061|nr:glycoside hydrolase family 15 [Phycicoccus sp. Root101]